jgi:hypothetical protein
MWQALMRAWEPTQASLALEKPRRAAAPGRMETDSDEVRLLSSYFLVGSAHPALLPCSHFSTCAAIMPCSASYLLCRAAHCGAISSFKAVIEFAPKKQPRLYLQLVVSALFVRMACLTEQADDDEEADDEEVADQDSSDEAGSDRDEAEEEAANGARPSHLPQPCPQIAASARCPLVPMPLIVPCLTASPASPLHCSTAQIQVVCLYHRGCLIFEQAPTALTVVFSPDRMTFRV